MVAALVNVFGGGEDVSSNDGGAITAALSVICLETALFETVVVAVGIEEDRNFAVDWSVSRQLRFHMYRSIYIVPTLLWPIASPCAESPDYLVSEKSCHENRPWNSAKEQKKELMFFATDAFVSVSDYFTAMLMDPWIYISTVRQTPIVQVEVPSPWTMSGCSSAIIKTVLFLLPGHICFFR